MGKRLRPRTFRVSFRVETNLTRPELRLAIRRAILTAMPGVKKSTGTDLRELRGRRAKGDEL